MTIDYTPTGYVDKLLMCPFCNKLIHESAVEVLSVPGQDKPKCSICKVELVSYEEEEKNP